MMPEKTCRLCDEVLSNSYFGQHVFNKHGMLVEDYYYKFDTLSCRTCGKRIPFYKSRHQTYSRTFCSRECTHKYNSGKKHPRWNNGTVDDKGYKYVVISKFPVKYHDILTPMASTITKQVAEHRAIMAIKLGRSLLSSESVHHRSGDKSDNRRSNLELRVKNHGNGATAAVFKCPHCGKRYDTPVVKEATIDA